jgi:hypothetical protein
MLLGNTVLCWHEFREVAGELRADRSRIPAALEEVLRWSEELPRSGHREQLAGRRLTCRVDDERRTAGGHRGRIEAVARRELPGDHDDLSSRRVAGLRVLDLEPLSRITGCSVVDVVVEVVVLAEVVVMTEPRGIANAPSAREPA